MAFISYSLCVNAMTLNFIDFNLFLSKKGLVPVLFWPYLLEFFIFLFFNFFSFCKVICLRLFWIINLPMQSFLSFYYKLSKKLISFLIFRWKNQSITALKILFKMFSDRSLALYLRLSNLLIIRLSSSVFNSITATQFCLLI